MRDALSGCDSPPADCHPLTPARLRVANPRVLAQCSAPASERYQSTLRISWKRQAIHHGEEEATGNAFQVLVPPGTHILRWEVHAANMAKPRNGEWHINCRDCTDGAPITTMAELRAELAIEDDAE